MRVPSTDPKARENRLRQAALRRGYLLTKARGDSIWFLHEHRARVATIYRSLNEVEAALEETADDETSLLEACAKTA